MIFEEYCYQGHEFHIQQDSDISFYAIISHHHAGGVDVMERDNVVIAIHQPSREINITIHIAFIFTLLVLYTCWKRQLSVSYLVSVSQSRN